MKAKVMLTAAVMGVQLLFAGGAYAGTGHGGCDNARKGVRELRQDRREVRRGERELERDRQALREAVGRLRYDLAVGAPAWKIRQDREAVRELRREVRADRRELRQDRAEFRRDKRELRRRLDSCNEYEI